MRRFLFFVSVLLLLFSVSVAVADQVEIELTSALKAAMNNHPAIKGKLAEMQAQGYRIDTAKSGRYPNMSGQVSAQDDGNQYGSLRVRQPLWAFGKIDTPIVVAKAQQGIEQLKLLQVQRQVLEQTAVAYAQVRGVQQRLQVAEENIGEHQKLFERIERRQVGQLASETDARLAFSRLTQAKSQRERIAGELQVAIAELESLTRVSMTLDQPPNFASVLLPERGSIGALADKYHADIRVKKAEIKVAKYNVALEKIASTPTLYAEAEWDFFDSSATDKTRVGLRLEGSLEGIGLGIISRVKSASSQVDVARQDLQMTRNDVALRITSLLTNLALQERVKRAQRASVDAVQETRESFYRQYDSGRKTWLEVLNIQRELTEQRLQLAQADSARFDLNLRIAALIGGLDGMAGIYPVIVD
ncbi:MAG: transporter [Desulfuromonas sp.]|nr:MAG: transporter [Desulfuromonas sp.]